MIRQAGLRRRDDEAIKWLPLGVPDGHAEYDSDRASVLWPLGAGSDSDVTAMLVSNKAFSLQFVDATAEA